MKIMLCLDPKEENHEDTLAVTAAQTAAFKGEVLLIVSHVVDDKDYPKRMEPTIELLKRANSFFQAQGLCSKTMITFRGFEEDKGEHLLSISREHRIDEIIVGVKKRSKLGKILLGSVAQFIILNADCPVVTVGKWSKRIKKNGSS